ncbi:hypothetical protein LCGC14_1884280 [marine sediment metagenome]|uniref:Uncharacterized protein n=1 Tax=marine sediment metagenome TaxID=412755 RepID=A0A0F9G1B2_9ZZZZ
MVSRKERRHKDLLEEKKRLEKKWLALTGNVIEHGPDKGYPKIDFKKRMVAEKELVEVRKELDGE